MRKAESRKQKAEGRKQKAESRRQKAEGRKQKAESRRQKAESRRQKLECRCHSERSEESRSAWWRMEGRRIRARFLAALGMTRLGWVEFLESATKHNAKLAVSDF